MSISLERIVSLLKIAHESKASDLHLSVGSPPIIRVHGTLQQVGSESLQADDTRSMAEALLNADQIDRFNQAGELDFRMSLKDVHGTESMPIVKEDA